MDVCRPGCPHEPELRSLLGPVPGPLAPSSAEDVPIAGADILSLSNSLNGSKRKARVARRDESSFQPDSW